MRRQDRWRRSPGASVGLPPAVWPSDWSGLAPDERVRVVVAAITDGVTARPDELVGLTDDEIRRVEAAQDGPVRDAYRTFLAQIGGGAGRFLEGTDVYHPRVLRLGAAARELLAANGSTFAFAASDRVFALHQGYQFDFMRGSGADPEVWSYSEGRNGDVPLLSFGRFTDWLRAFAESEIAGRALCVASRPRNLTFFRIRPDGRRTEER